MSQNETIEKTFTKNDRRTALADTLVDADGDPIDLTGHTVALLMKNNAGTTKVNYSAATVDDATSGEVSYSWALGDLDTAGVYWYWWRVTRTSDSKVEHFPGDGRKRKLTVVEAS